MLRKDRFSVAYLARVSVIAAVYAAATVTPPLNSISYGPVQFRLSEALTVLAYVSDAAIPGLAVGCFLANLASPFLAWDLTFGVAATFVAACLTRVMPHPCLAPLPPVIINAVVVAWYVSVLCESPYLVTAGYIAIGEATVCYLLGYPLLILLLKNPSLLRLVKG
ncbi:MAG TPA: QueT transporter family protein [Firmicutes bacterium]|nr:QueT transporter family protein [Bacillota bacterium]